MAYLNSTAIKVFPTAHRTGNNGNESAFRLSEKHLGQLLTLSIKGDKFVKEIEGVIYIVLMGHIFEVAKSTLTNIFPSATEVYAEVKSRTISEDFGEELAPFNNAITVGLDDNGQFIGINFSSSDPESNLSIKVLEKVGDNNWMVPDDSRVVLLSSDVANEVSGKLVPISKHFEIDGNGYNNTYAFEVTGGDSYFEGSVKIDTTLEVGENPSINPNITGTITRAVRDRDGNEIDKTYAKTLAHPTGELNKLQLKNGDNETIGDIITIDNVSNAGRADNVKTQVASAKIYLAGSTTSTANPSDSLYKNSGLSFTPSTGTLSATKFDGISSFVSSTSSFTGDVYLIGKKKNDGEQAYRSNSVYFDASGALTATTVSGTTITANTFNATSDERLKESIKTFEPHKSILELPVVEFDYKSDKTHHIGCIAQDLKEICPEIVHTNKEGYLTIEENKLVYLLLDEVKKLRKEIDELKKGE